MWISACDILGGQKAHLLKGLAHGSFAAGGVAFPVNDQGLLHDLANGHVGVEAGEGVLEDALDAMVEGPRVAVADGDILAIESDCAGCWPQQAEADPS